MASFQESLDNLQNIDLNNLDFENVGSWPSALKGIFYVLLFAVVMALGYFLILTEKQDQLTFAESQEATLKEQFKQKARLAANLEDYVAQMTQMKESFGALLQQLPSDTEVPGLVEDINRIGIDSGLNIDLIELQPELKKEFYIELPIKIIVIGRYHDLGAFVSGVANLDRIVTLHDFSINPEANKSRSNMNLIMEITAKTYRYNDENDEASS